jgi:uracil-DNA glycosylase family 4
MDGSDPLKHRLNLWLKSEQALGLPSVPRVQFAPTPPAESARPKPNAPATPPRQNPPPPSPPRPPQVAPQGARQTDWFRAPSTPTPPARSAGAASAALPLLDTPFTGPILSRDEKLTALAVLDRDEVKGCVKCGLHRTRDKTVFGEGDPDAQICFIGEGPGKDEDASGRPFVGRAGQKLDDMIRGMGLKREDVYICNIVKCRAYMPDINKDRPPSEEETAACTPYLLKQMEIIRPKVVVTLGLPSTRYLLKSKDSMTRMRGNWHAWRGIKVMPTWHPAYVLRNYTEQTRREVWDDLKKVLIELDLPIPKRSGKQD